MLKQIGPTGLTVINTDHAEEFIYGVEVIEDYLHYTVVVPPLNMNRELPQ